MGWKQQIGAGDENTDKSLLRMLFQWDCSHSRDLSLSLICSWCVSQEKDLPMCTLIQEPNNILMDSACWF